MFAQRKMQFANRWMYIWPIQIVHVAHTLSEGLTQFLKYFSMHRQSRTSLP